MKFFILQNLDTMQLDVVYSSSAAKALQAKTLQDTNYSGAIVEAYSQGFADIDQAYAAAQLGIIPLGNSVSKTVTPEEIQSTNPLIQKAHSTLKKHEQIRLNLEAADAELDQLPDDVAEIDSGSGQIADNVAEADKSIPEPPPLTWTAADKPQEIQMMDKEPNAVHELFTEATSFGDENINQLAQSNIQFLSGGDPGADTNVLQQIKSAAEDPLAINRRVIAIAGPKDFVSNVSAFDPAGSDPMIAKLEAILASKERQGPITVRTNLGVGFDTLAARAALNLKNRGLDVNLDITIPYSTNPSINRSQDILAAADKVTYEKVGAKVARQSLLASADEVITASPPNAKSASVGAQVIADTPEGIPVSNVFSDLLSAGTKAQAAKNVAELGGAIIAPQSISPAGYSPSNDRRPSQGPSGSSSPNPAPDRGTSQITPFDKGDAQAASLDRLIGAVPEVGSNISEGMNFKPLEPGRGSLSPMGTPYNPFEAIGSMGSFETNTQIEKSNKEAFYSEDAENFFGSILGGSSMSQPRGSSASTGSDKPTFRPLELGVGSGVATLGVERDITSDISPMDAPGLDTQFKYPPSVFSQAIEAASKGMGVTSARGLNTHEPIKPTEDILTLGNPVSDLLEGIKPGGYKNLISPFVPTYDLPEGMLFPPTPPRISDIPDPAISSSGIRAGIQMALSPGAAVVGNNPLSGITSRMGNISRGFGMLDLDAISHTALGALPVPKLLTGMLGQAVLGSLVASMFTPQQKVSSAGADQMANLALLGVSTDNKSPAIKMARGIPNADVMATMSEMSSVVVGATLGTMLGEAASRMASSSSTKRIARFGAGAVGWGVAAAVAPLIVNAFERMRSSASANTINPVHAMGMMHSSINSGTDLANMAAHDLELQFADENGDDFDTVDDSDLPRNLGGVLDEDGEELDYELFDG